ncbi:MAG: hypothetical protein C4306_12390 [Thermoleophilia bacterium]
MSTVVPEAIELTDEEFAALVERRIRDRLGMSLEEFRDAISSGALDPEGPNVGDLALLVGAQGAS